MQKEGRKLKMQKKGGDYMYKNFIADVLEEGVMLDEIEDYVEEWHTSDTLEMTLQEFIGLDDYEYEIWLKEGDDILRDILYCRRHGLKLKEYYSMSSGEKIAARSYDLETVKEYKNNGK